MTFDDFLKKNWPPVCCNRLIMSPSSKKKSNYWTQYLEFLIQQWCAQNNYYWIRELECPGDKKKRLDYLITKDNLGQYFVGDVPAFEMNWSVLIEAEWDKGQYTKFVQGDFVKLQQWDKTRNSRRVKIVIINTVGRAKSWSQIHEDKLRDMMELARKKHEDNSHYLILMTCVYNSNKYIGVSVSDNWKKPRIYTVPIEK